MSLNRSVRGDAEVYVQILDGELESVGVDVTPDDNGSVLR